ncbi:EamA family transporter RarD [Undibacterium oligocarboniphilum]|uniref:EamA family transporter RarD n=1 Tax=Undibacterium oligocarboniphilum TaxID=666702 RepID=A0A850Q9N8_9BURK|nr:EamA family transporter RarD [Undibacterium oligocarboniphilum]MBC3869052.1 EamA family transporter RarD [Undibacterium oligocarboniphilum]NVO77032.1 EamA family transporter RarD [Undibacterium oligocarboniphilum]
MRKGTLLAGSAYTIWGLFPLYFKALHSVPALEILLNRMVWSLLFLAGILTWRRQWSWISETARQPRIIGGFALSALLLSANWFVYIWAVNDGHVIDASLGYFITPLVNILIGSVFLRERLRYGQWLAVAFAALGVGWLTWQTGRLPWIGLTLALTFGTYGLLRKTSPLGALEGLSLETALLFPFAAAYLCWLSLHGGNALLTQGTDIQMLLALSGPVTAIPLLLFAAGARRIPMTTLGLLQYIAPMVQLLLGVWLFHEAFDQHKLFGFIAIWAALVIYSAEGLWLSFRTPKSA